MRTAVRRLSAGSWRAPGWGPCGAARRLAPDRDRGRLHPDGAHRRDRQVARRQGRMDGLRRSGGTMAQAPTEERARPKKGMAWIPAGRSRWAPTALPRGGAGPRGRRSTGSGWTSTRSRTPNSALREGDRARDGRRERRPTRASTRTRIRSCSSRARSSFRRPRARSTWSNHCNWWT